MMKRSLFGLAHRLTEPEPPQIGAEAEILKESSAAEPLPLTTIYVKGKTRHGGFVHFERVELCVLLTE
ncbi:hypothetical protein BE221DRAFT_214318 [Ostreococcus tauri]|uniref:Uncharacterized protein n=1 Tax=Ostreococcus tauri TaxID=70448 RepID=A0A1Y5IAM0_OSTTA|nr:hypothetical protein BE221DRAFT_214318 [Ostreococcus tauri]